MRLRTALSIVLVACAILPALADEPSLLTPEQLDDYIARFKKHTVAEDVIAFAAGGQSDFLVPGKGHVVVFFYPTATARDFMLFLSEETGAAPPDNATYRHTAAPTTSMFSGEMRRFETPWRAKDGWARLTFVDRGALHMSAPIRIDSASRPTTFDPAFVTMEWKDGRPEFRWDPAQMGEAELYFEVVSDPDKKMLSGTYTKEPRFYFYDTSNVVLNLREGRGQDSSPALGPEGRHAFLMMAIDANNWVTAISAKLFEPPAAEAD